MHVCMYVCVCVCVCMYVCMHVCIYLSIYVQTSLLFIVSLCLLLVFSLSFLSFYSFCLSWQLLAMKKDLKTELHNRDELNSRAASINEELHAQINGLKSSLKDADKAAQVKIVETQPFRPLFDGHMLCS